MKYIPVLKNTEKWFEVIIPCQLPVLHFAERGFDKWLTGDNSKFLYGKDTSESKMSVCRLDNKINVQNVYTFKLKRSHVKLYIR